MVKDKNKIEKLSNQVKEMQLDGPYIYFIFSPFSDFSLISLFPVNISITRLIYSW